MRLLPPAGHAGLPILSSIMLLVGGVALFAASQQATAKAALRTAYVVVPPAGLETALGRQAVAARVARAASNVCTIGHPRQPGTLAARRACIHKAVLAGRLQMASMLAARPVLAEAGPAHAHVPSAASPEEPSVL